MTSLLDVSVRLSKLPLISHGSSDGILMPYLPLAWSHRQCISIGDLSTDPKYKKAALVRGRLLCVRGQAIVIPVSDTLCETTA